MATEVSREFDVAGGRVVLTVKDALGNVGIHSIYVTGPQGVKDVSTAIAKVLSDTDAACTDLQAALESAGWKANGS